MQKIKKKKNPRRETRFKLYKQTTNKSKLPIQLTKPLTVRFQFLSRQVKCLFCWLFPQIDLKVYFVILSWQENIFEKLSKITEGAEDEGCLELLLCDGMGHCTLLRECSKDDPRGDRVEKSLLKCVFAFLSHCLWTIITFPFTRNLLQQLRLLKWCPWDNTGQHKDPAWVMNY